MTPAPSRLVLSLDLIGRATAVPGARQGGVTGFISWGRLIAALRHEGEFKASESPVQFTCDERGITFIVERRKDEAS